MPTLPPDAVAGWPFLVAAGRRRDYTVVVAPDFMVAAGEAGRLCDVVVPGAESDPARVLSVVTASGRRVSAAYRTHLLTEADLDAPGGTGAPTAPPRDEYNRPLLLAFGFVTHAPPAGTPSLEADLDDCRAAVLPAYRAFLEDEDGFSVAPSGALPIRSGSPRDPEPLRTVVPSPAAVEPARGRGDAGRHGAVVVGLLAVLVALVLVVVLATRGDAEPTCPTPTRTANGAYAEANQTCSPG